MITRLAVSGYRSLRDVRLALTRLILITGANGGGKSSLYRALRLLADVAQGRVVQSLASEGGLQSTLWAGPESFSREVKAGHHPVQGLARRKPIALKLGFASPSCSYAIDLGLPVAPAVFAAALKTIQAIGDSEALQAAVSEAFPGAILGSAQSDGYIEVKMRQHGILRPLKGVELSDGTLRYLLLVAALLTPRPPQLMILNEPEASLHPDLVAPLARLIAAASRLMGVMVVSHLRALVEACREAPGASEIRLEKQLGETVAPDAAAPKWVWPAR